MLIITICALTKIHKQLVQQASRSDSIGTYGVGIVQNKLIGPHFFERSTKEASHVEFLQNVLLVLAAKELPLAIYSELWYMHDGAPVYRTIDVMNYPNNT